MSLARKKLIAELEGIISNHIYNKNNQIRYPIDFKDKTRLKGKHTILDVNENNEDIFYSGKYKFGANELFIYEALNSILDFLENKGVDIWTAEEEYEDYDDDLF